MNLFAKKSLGQHFLNSKHVLEQILAAADIKSNETILEIGPGTGVLTSELLKSASHVITIEKDMRAMSLLQEKFAESIGAKRLELIQADILETKRAELGLNERGYAVVANIPYYITGAILESFLEYSPRPSRMILLVQKEVAERILARDGKESILSISVKAFGMPTIIAKVPPGAFTPPPTVDSAILAITGISDGFFMKYDVQVGRFFETLHAGFAHKRKFLKRNLETVAAPEKLDFAWKKTGLNEKARAEDLALEQWFKMCAELS